MTVTKGFLDAPIFGIVSEVAENIGVRAFVIGGYVRDCFLGRKNDDIDIVVEGSGIALAAAVADHIKKTERHGCRVSIFKNFGTAMLKYHGIEVEFVGARKNPIIVIHENRLSRTERWRTTRKEGISLSMLWHSASRRVTSAHW